MIPTIIRKPKTSKDIALGVRLAKMHRREIGPSDIGDILTAAGVKYVLVGAHAVNGYSGRPRTTVDVDVIARFPKKAAKAILASYPHLTTQDTPVVIRLKDGEHEAVDVLKPESAKLWPALLADARKTRVGRKSVFIPSLEGVLAAKFSAMVSIGRRQADKMQDGADFIRIVEANKDIDLKKLSEFGDLVYPEGGKEILKLVADARAGNTLEI